MLLENLEILYIEDSHTQAMLLKETLEKNQLKVQLAKDGVEGLQQVRLKPPSLVISDIEMPRMNGYEFCKTIKTNTSLKHIPVILLTNLTDVMDVIKGIECGADSFLTKPCETNLLLTTIQNALKNKNVTSGVEKGKLEFYFDGSMHALEVDQIQITKLLLSTYSNAIQKNHELEDAYRKLNRIHEELEKYNETLQKLNEQKNHLLGMAAHDLRNPLSVISGFSGFLLNTPDIDTNQEKVHRMIEHIHNSSNFMLQLIDNLLDISKIESGTMSLTLTDVDLNELINKNMLLFETLAQKKNIHIQFDPDPSLTKIQCDAGRILQILQNIIFNAIKFSKPNAEIKIYITSLDNEITLCIEDSGIGMPEEMVKNLFQPFTKMRTLGTAGEKGSGLGLAIVSKIVKEHNGKIWVESERDKGTKFFVSLPIQQPVSISAV